MIIGEDFEMGALVRGSESLYWSGPVSMSRAFHDTGAGSRWIHGREGIVCAHFKIKNPFGPGPPLLRSHHLLQHYILWLMSTLSINDIGIDGKSAPVLRLLAIDFCLIISIMSSIAFHKLINYRININFSFFYHHQKMCLFHKVVELCKPLVLIVSCAAGSPGG